MDDPCDDWSHFQTWQRKQVIAAMPHHTCKICGESVPDFAMSATKGGWCDDCTRYN